MLIRDKQRRAISTEYIRKIDGLAEQILHCSNTRSADRVDISVTTCLNCGRRARDISDNNCPSSWNTRVMTVVHKIAEVAKAV
jgi:hypothetical protein